MKYTKQTQNSVKNISRRAFAKGLAVGLIPLVAFVLLAGGLQYGQADGQAEDALFIDQDGTVNAKKYVGDGSDLTIKMEMGEQTLKDAMALIKQALDKCISKPYGFYTFRSAWIESLGEYGPAEIDVNKGDIVKVDLIGSAEKSEFYYNIVETTGNAYIIDASPQVIMNPEPRWRSITTIGLFKAKEDTTLKFSANFTKGDESERIRVFGLTLIATVVGSVAHKMNLALQEGAEAWQSSTGWGGVPKRAIDGNPSGIYNEGSVTHTADEPYSWWQVRLPKPAKIEEIVIWNRSDCCGIRLSNLRISVLDDSKEEIWGKNFNGPIGRFKLFKPDAPVKGRFVKVQILGKNKDDNGHLSLAEVEVFGEFTE
jgi:hypothetical protein